MRFTSGDVSYSVCGPNRSGLMTGRHQGCFGFNTNPIIGPTDIKAGIWLEEALLFAVLRQLTYEHGDREMASGGSSQSLARGFDEFKGFLSRGRNYFPEHLTLNDLSKGTAM
jgi:arylsulfatase A-like enzyme